MKKILFVAMNNMGNEFTGGDRIWIELSKSWKPDIHWCEEAQHLWFGTVGKPVKPTIWNIAKNTVYKTWLGITTLPKNKYDYVYSVSDFYPDLITALVYKLHHYKECKWVAGYYLVAPPPFSTTTPYKRFLFFKGLLYWLMQRVSLWLVNRYADVVMVTSEPDRKYFSGKKVIVVRGGVSKTGDRIEPKYDAIFIGRFHYQKGVIELIDIWKKVQERIPKAKLVMIGDGPLFDKCKQLAVGLNIEFVGYQNGEDKYKLIQQSKIVLHPATYDSGGMACAEAMAFGLPAVGFDLPAFENYYPMGMLKAIDKEEFADYIVKLLTDTLLYHIFSNHAKCLIFKYWLWENRTKDIWNELTSV